MQHDYFSFDDNGLTRLRKKGANAARRMLVLMVCVLTFTVVTSMIAMFDYVSSSTASPTIPSMEWSVDLASALEIPDNPARPDWK